MITLAAADTIAGGADAATKVTVTIFGMELNGTTETYKALYQGQLGATAATIYTVPGSTQTFIRSISVVNTDASASHTFQLFQGGTAAANAITPVYTLAATDGQAHLQQFRVLCEVASAALQTEGQGSSRRAAEQEAASRALEKLKA